MEQRIIIIAYMLITILLGCQQKPQYISYPEFYNSVRHLAKGKADLSFDDYIIKVDSLFSLVPRVPSSYYFKMAQSCADQSRCDLIEKYLIAGFETGLEYNSGSIPSKIEGCYEQINIALLEENKIHQRNFNYLYKNAIDSMYNIDQKARNTGIPDVYEVDSLNYNLLLNLIDKYGYPCEKTIGSASAFNAFIMILHMDRDEGNKVFGPILNKALAEGDIWPRGYA